MNDNKISLTQSVLIVFVAIIILKIFNINTLLLIGLLLKSFVYMGGTKTLVGDKDDYIVMILRQWIVCSSYILIEPIFEYLIFYPFLYIIKIGLLIWFLKFSNDDEEKVYPNIIGPLHNKYQNSINVVYTTINNGAILIIDSIIENLMNIYVYTRTYGTEYIKNFINKINNNNKNNNNNKQSKKA